MIKNVCLKKFHQSCSFPAYVYKCGIDKYTLIATVMGKYQIILARLFIGKSNSGDTVLTHAIFESYDEYGKKMVETQFRTNGLESEFMAVKNVMWKAGIKFFEVAPCHFSELLKGLGAYYQAVNPDIDDYTVMSQICH